LAAGDVTHHRPIILRGGFRVPGGSELAAGVAETRRPVEQGHLVAPGHRRCDLRPVGRLLYARVSPHHDQVCKALDA
jgi:hypothetical protein